MAKWRQRGCDSEVVFAEPYYAGVVRKPLKISTFSASFSGRKSAKKSNNLYDEST